MRKERFLARSQSKLDLPSEYNISATFNVFDLSLFDVGDDSRSNSLKSGE